MIMSSSRIHILMLLTITQLVAADDARPTADSMFPSLSQVGTPAFPEEHSELQSLIPTAPLRASV